MCHIIWDHTVLPATWQRWHSRLNPSQLKPVLETERFTWKAVKLMLMFWLSLCEGSCSCMFSFICYSVYPPYRAVTFHHPHCAENRTAAIEAINIKPLWLFQILPGLMVQPQVVLKMVPHFRISRRWWRQIRECLSVIAMSLWYLRHLNIWRHRRLRSPRYAVQLWHNIIYLLLLHSFNGLFSRTTWVIRHQKSRTIMAKPIWIYWGKRQWVAVASAGPYANLHLASDR